MKKTRRMDRIAAAMDAVLLAVREGAGITAAEVQAKTNLPRKQVRVRLTEARAKGTLTYVRAQGLTLWCEPQNSDRVYRTHSAKTARGNRFQQPRTARELQILAALSERPFGLKVRDLCAEYGVCKTSIKNRMYDLRESGLVSCHPGTGSIHTTWFLVEHRKAAVAAYEASRHDANESRRKRKNASRIAPKVECDETPEPGDFFEARIIPAHLAPRIAPRGPVSVWGLASW